MEANKLYQLQELLQEFKQYLNQDQIVVNCINIVNREIENYEEEFEANIRADVEQDMRDNYQEKYE